MLNSKQRAKLKSLASKIDGIFQIGKNGLSDNLKKQVNDALEARELIKITVLETSPEENQILANTLALDTKSEVVQIIGNKIVLYRKSKKPKIEI